MGEGTPASFDVGIHEDNVRAIDRTFAAGLSALSDVTGIDGALTARDKALLLVAGAAVRDRLGLSAEVERAIGLGVDPAELEALALALCLSRGAGPCRAVLDALPTAPDVATTTMPHTPGPDTPHADIPEMVEDFRRIFGDVPDRISVLAEHSPGGLRAYHLMRRAVLTVGRLDPIVAELALVTVNACEHRSDFAAVHVTGARRAGATEQQLVEAGLCAVHSGGVAAWLSASEAIVATRPDNHTSANTSIDPPATTRAPSGASTQR